MRNRRIIGVSIGALVLTLCVYGRIFAEQTGVLKGKVLDEKTGKPLPGATVFLEGTRFGQSTDGNGEFRISNIPVGTYTVVVRYISYREKRVDGVEIRANEETTLTLELQSESVQMEGVEVTARAYQDNAAALLSMQKRALVVQDGFSREEMSKTGASTAAEAVSKVTGCSVFDDKFVVVRGLTDRYVATQLNGALLVSADPYKNSPQLDLIPSDLLDNLIVVKTASPELPGSFSGGVVNVALKEIPDEFLFNLQMSVGYNPQSSFRSDFLSYVGGKYDWLGYDDGSRQMPSILKKYASLLRSPAFYIQARRNEEYARILDEASKSVSSVMAPTPVRSFTNYAVGVSFGNKYQLFEKPLGLLLNLQHARSFRSYANGKNLAWNITGKDADQLFNFYDLVDHKSVESPEVNGMLGVSYQLSPLHMLSFLQVYNHSAEKVARFQSGVIPGFVSGSDKIFETRTLQFTERGLSTSQLKGEHSLPILSGVELQWLASYTESYQNEPDLRFFANERVGDSAYYISISEYDPPYHYFRYLNDYATELRTDFTLPFNRNQKTESVKFGARYFRKKRSFDEYRFSYRNQSGRPYSGDPTAYFAPENVGIIGYDSVRNQWIVGNYLVDNTQLSNNYRGEEEIVAAYGMITQTFFQKLRFVGGLRIESTRMRVQSLDTTKDVGHIAQIDLFPSLNLTYVASEKTNLRFSYSRTIARPTMRELAPFVSYDFIGGFLYVGNPNLQATLIHNLDLRWEYYPAIGELLAVSAYYKHFDHPIVQLYNTKAYNPEIVYINSNDAEVYGVELEIRKGLEIVSRVLKNFSIGANLAYIYSRVPLEKDEYQILSEINPEIQPYRPFQGQSPYIVNVLFSYVNSSAGLEGDLSYTLYGKRLVAVGANGVPDVYESPRPLLNLSLSKQMGRNYKLKVQVKNLLDAEYRTVQQFRGQEYINQQYRSGRTVSLSISYNIQ